MFLGEYQLKFSGQGRIILPKKLREGISGSEIVLSKGFEGCIWGFDPGEWELQANKQLETSAVEEKARILRRYLFSSSLKVELDTQGRFVIPANLLQYAKIKETVVVIGAGDHFEVWEANLWERHISKVEREYGRIS